MVAPVVAASVENLIKHATHAVQNKATKTGDTAASSKSVQLKQTTLAPPKYVYPESDHGAVLDAAAAFRRLAFKGCSAVRAACSVLKLANTSNAKDITIFFDLGNSDAFPPQRSELHRRRYAGKSLAYDDAVEIFKMLKCEKKRFADVHDYKTIVVSVGS